jgi:D-alanyl-D-alanine carboxypeptidase
VDNRLARALQAALDRWQLFAPCLGANVSIDDGLHGAWHGASGYRDADTKTPMPLHAQSYIYSITKTFTAVRVLQLAESGALALDDPVSSHLAELPFPATVTLRRLLNHTAGVPSYTSLPDYLPANRESPGRPWSYEQVRDRTCTGRFDFEPGTGWSYSNTGYMLLAKLIETVTGKSYAENVRNAIAEPLCLSRTSVAEDVDDGALVPGYCRYLNDDHAIEDITRRYHPGWCLTGLISSTTDDIAKFFSRLLSGSLISAASLTQMKCAVQAGTADEAGALFRKPAYGLGLMVDTGWEYGGLYGHGGDGPGFNTWAMHLPAFHGRPLTLVAFCNTTMGGHPAYLVRDLLRVLSEGTRAA